MLLTRKQASLVAQVVKNLPAMQETWVRSLSQEDPLEKEMATHSQYSCMGNPMERSPWGHRRVRLDLATKQEWGNRLRRANALAMPSWLLSGITRVHTQLCLRPAYVLNHSPRQTWSFQWARDPVWPWPSVRGFMWHGPVPYFQNYRKHDPCSFLLYLLSDVKVKGRVCFHFFLQSSRICFWLAAEKNAGVWVTCGLWTGGKETTREWGRW